MLVVDWERLIGDLQWLYGEVDPRNPELLRIPVSTIVLSERLSVSRGTLRRWMEGAEPRHVDGEMLIAHWCRLSGKSREYLPKEKSTPSVAKV